MNYYNSHDVCQQFLELVQKLSPNSETHRKLELEKKLIIEVIQILTNELSEVDTNAKVVLLPPCLMHKINTKASLFINTMSFQHMSADSVGFYLGEASRLDSHYIFLNNRDWIRDPTDLIMSE